jgi:hypothetical protein
MAKGMHEEGLENEESGNENTLDIDKNENVEEDAIFQSIGQKVTVKSIFAELETSKKKKWWAKDSESYKRVTAAAKNVESSYSSLVEPRNAKTFFDGIKPKYDELMDACEAYHESHFKSRWSSAGTFRQEKISQMFTSAHAEKELIEKNRSDAALLGGTFEQFLVSAATGKDLESGLIKKPGSGSGGEVMSSSDFMALLGDNTDASDSINAIKILLDTYHQFEIADVHEAMRTTLMRIIVLCSAAKGDARSTMSGLYQQCVNKYYSIDGFKAKEVKKQSPKTKKEKEKEQNNLRMDFFTDMGFNVMSIIDEGKMKDEDALIEDLTFSEYGLMTDSEARLLGDTNVFNIERHKKGGKSKIGKQGEHIYRGDGYIKAQDNFGPFQEYVRDKAAAARNKQPFLQNPAFELLLEAMDAATDSGTTTKKTRFFRMVTSKYLNYALNIPLKNGDIPEDVAYQVNQRAGTIITNDDFMSVGYRVDEVFKGHPIMLNLLCDEGVRLFPSDNYDESELIFPRNTRYMILGACLARGQEFERSQYRIKGRKKMTYGGVEIFAKILN